jgi:hypothetical protein
MEPPRFNAVHEKESAVRLLEKLNEQRKLRWEDIVEKTNFIHSSHETWNLLKKLGTDALQIVPPKTVQDRSKCLRDILAVNKNCHG